jgi:hypothetical protein
MPVSRMTDIHMAFYALSTGVFVLLFQAIPTGMSGTPWARMNMDGMWYTYGAGVPRGQPITR